MIWPDCLIHQLISTQCMPVKQQVLKHQVEQLTFMSNNYTSVGLAAWIFNEECRVLYILVIVYCIRFHFICSLAALCCIYRKTKCACECVTHTGCRRALVTAAEHSCALRETGAVNKWPPSHTSFPQAFQIFQCVLWFTSVLSVLLLYYRNTHTSVPHKPPVKIIIYSW